MPPLAACSLRHIDHIVFCVRAEVEFTYDQHGVSRRVVVSVCGAFGETFLHPLGTLDFYHP